MEILSGRLYTILRAISTQENFPWTENFPKISLLKVENFQLQNFFPTENLCRPIIFHKLFFPRKIFLSGNNWPLVLTRSSCEKCNYRFSGRNRTCGPAIPVQRSNQLSYRGQLSLSNHKFLFHLSLLRYASFSSEKLKI